MGDSHKQGIENDSSNSVKFLETTSEKNLKVLSMEDAAMIDDCIKGIEIENSNGTCSKETLLPLENEPMAMTANREHGTENLICDLHELLVKASSRTFNLLTVEYANVEGNGNDDNINQQIPKEDIAPRNIFDRTQSYCNVHTGRAKKNNIEISSYDSNEQQNEFFYTCPTKQLTKRVKSSLPISKSKNVNEENVKLTPTFSTEFKFNTNSTLQCMDSLISRRRMIYKKRQEAREKLARMENETLSNIRKQKKKKVKRSPRTKKLNPTFSSVYFVYPDSNVQCMESLIERRRFNFNKKQDLKKCEKDKKHRKHKPKVNNKKVKKGGRGQKSKKQNNDTLHNEDKIPASPQESRVTYHSSCMYSNKNRDFHQDNKYLPEQYAAEVTNEMKKVSWCTIM